MKGFTVNPQVNEEGEYVGASISTGNISGVAPQGFATNEVTGQTSYFTEKSRDPSDLADNQYVSTLLELHTDLPAALAWSGTNWTDEQRADYDEAIFGDDYEKLNESIERLMSDYYSSKPTQPVEKKVEENEEDSDIPDLSDLYDNQPDENVASVWEDYAGQTSGALSMVAQLTADFHNGYGSQDDLIEKALSSDFSREELLAAFNHIQGNN